MPIEDRAVTLNAIESKELAGKLEREYDGAVCWKDQGNADDGNTKWGDDPFRLEDPPSVCATKHRQGLRCHPAGLSSSVCNDFTHMSWNVSCQRCKDIAAAVKLVNEMLVKLSKMLVKLRQMLVKASYWQ